MNKAISEMTNKELKNLTLQEIKEMSVDNLEAFIEQIRQLNK